jgi:hypothetical protein
MPGSSSRHDQPAPRAHPRAAERRRPASEDSVRAAGDGRRAVPMPLSPEMVTAWRAFAAAAAWGSFDTARAAETEGRPALRAPAHVHNRPFARWDGPRRSAGTSRTDEDREDARVLRGCAGGAVAAGDGAPRSGSKRRPIPLPYLLFPATRLHPLCHPDVQSSDRNPRGSAWEIEDNKKAVLDGRKSKTARETLVAGARNQQYLAFAWADRRMACFDRREVANVASASDLRSLRPSTMASCQA